VLGVLGILSLPERKNQSIKSVFDSFIPMCNSSGGGGKHLNITANIPIHPNSHPSPHLVILSRVNALLICHQPG